MRDPTVFDRIEARLTALEARPDLEEPLAHLLARTELLERAQPADQVVNNPQSIGASGALVGEATPSGAASGVLAGTYPGPTFAAIAFEPMKAINAKLENVAGAYNLQFAIPAGLGVVILRGVAKTKAAEPIAAKGIIATITSAALVARAIVVGHGLVSGTTTPMVVKTTGEIETLAEIPAGTEISFDGIAMST